MAALVALLVVAGAVVGVVAWTRLDLHAHRHARLLDDDGRSGPRPVREVAAACGGCRSQAMAASRSGSPIALSATPRDTLADPIPSDARPNHGAQPHGRPVPDSRP
ncbi:MAG: hypothetical protein ABT15_25390 [Pseudonocardia sp. SCN 73-27]|nr:MAG: hypothetical protein ABS80_15220 [Pseudonocardia sp. SCN 72-51]ODV02587.1 MAG: hypothetical protein ABT15_25390 [Pseudonocardia sp. SCN 73-27]